jgi:hypothetical protein
MQTHLITFQGTFAPQVPSGSSIIKEIVDGLAMSVAFGSSFVFNFGT